MKTFELDRLLEEDHSWTYTPDLEQVSVVEILLSPMNYQESVIIYFLKSLPQSPQELRQRLRTYNLDSFSSIESITLEFLFSHGVKKRTLVCTLESSGRYHIAGGQKIKYEAKILQYLHRWGIYVDILDEHTF